MNVELIEAVHGISLTVNQKSSAFIRRKLDEYRFLDREFRDTRYEEFGRRLRIQEAIRSVEAILKSYLPQQAA